MNLQYNLFNVLILLGAIQGLILCIYLLFFSKSPRSTKTAFVLFLFSLAYINLYYALLDIDFFAIFRPLHILPIPAKWLLGPGIYIYVKSLVQADRGLKQKDWLLFLPAFLINLPYYYWFAIAWKEGSYRIVRVVIETDFFRYNEVFSILFNLFILLYLLAWIDNQRKLHSFTTKSSRRFGILNSILLICLLIFCLNLELVAIDLLAHDGKETRRWYYSLWILHTLFIYGIGFLGFSKAEALLQPMKMQANEDENSDLLNALDLLMKEEKLFRNPELRIAEIAMKLESSPRELSRQINSALHCNFSTYVNRYRIQEVKEKLLSEAFEKYTLQHLAHEAGFKSKSSFHESFKAETGMTPSAFRKKAIKGRN
ncbi:MAG: helix-turn-helix domain-containing protein [Bacteroidia bacterium]|nr:helix-turn-helix domain-containing protein [Bacteroidia bacterium]